MATMPNTSNNLDLDLLGKRMKSAASPVRQVLLDLHARYRALTTGNSTSSNARCW